MARPHITPTGRSVSFGDDEVIVSKTDLKGIIGYANDVFLRVSGYSEAELIGQPHNILRHPEMPGCIFKLLWQTIQQGNELFAYVNNLAKNGDNYWVFAHVTPSFDGNGRIVGYHSNRRHPFADALPQVQQLYARLLAEEKRHKERSAAVEASFRLLEEELVRAGLSYSQWVFGLSKNTQLSSAT